MKLKTLIKLFAQNDINNFPVVFNGAKALDDLGYHVVDHLGNRVPDERLLFDVDNVEIINYTCVLQPLSLKELIDELPD